MYTTYIQDFTVYNGSLRDNIKMYFESKHLHAWLDTLPTYCRASLVTPFIWPQYSMYSNNDAISKWWLA